MSLGNIGRIAVSPYGFDSPRPSPSVIAGLTRNLMVLQKKIAGQARNDGGEVCAMILYRVSFIKLCRCGIPKADEYPPKSLNIKFAYLFPNTEHNLAFLGLFVQGFVSQNLLK